MTRAVQNLGRLGAELVRRFRRNATGNVAIIFAFASTMILVGVGSGIDLSRAYIARQKLSQAATLTCQYSTRNSVSTAGAFVNYNATVNAYAPKTLASQNWNTTIPVTDATQAGTAYFTGAAPTGSGTSSAVTGVTEMYANVPMTFLKIANLPSITVHAVVSCQTPPPSSGTTPGSYVMKEGFETPCGSYCFTTPSGNAGTTPTSQSTFPSSAAYLGSGGSQWYIMGYCLETDIVGIINGSTPEGTHAAELDCDNGSGSAGNSSLSTKVSLKTGYYEIRYNYRARVDYPNYDPTYICGSTASDLSWANDAGTGWYGTRTNQINVYLDLNTNGSPGLHTTIDGSQQLAGVNLVDMCVYSPAWIERSIKVNITTAGTYWLTFAADGHNDSYGAQLDNIRVCVDTCPTTLQDNFPTAWLAANNGGVNKVLFEDTFETNPLYTQDTSPSHYISKVHNLDTSYGTSGSSSGWPSQGQSGWATGPFDQVTYGVMQGAAQGSQYIMLDGWNSNGDPRKNRVISRPFLLDPGYYQVSYNYLSIVNFNIPSLPSYCMMAPSSGQIFGTQGNATGTIRYISSSTTANGDTNTEGVFFANGQLVSTPIIGAGQANQTSFNNPDGTVSTTPTVPIDNVNYQNYNANVPNPLIDMCGYADAWKWIQRTPSVKITKPGLYWLAFSANGGTADGNGAAIDDVKLTALGSPYMSNPPTTGLTVIPVPAPQPDTNYTNSGAFNGFYIVAEPFQPPAADQ